MAELRLGFLASHRGTNMQAVIDACKQGIVRATPLVVISNNVESEALERGRREGMAAHHLSSKTVADPGELDTSMVQLFEEHSVNLILLAGYMRKVGGAMLEAFRGRILNIHPALLPKFGGNGMYGIRVHQAVLEAKERETGVSVHVVTEEYDEGPILAQEKVLVHPDDTPETLSARVLEVEHRIYVDVLQGIATGRILLPA